MYLYKKTNSSMLCIKSSNSFARFCSHLNTIIDIQHTPLKKKGNKQNLRKQQILLLLWYLAPFFFFLISFSIIIWKENILE